MTVHHDTKSPIAAGLFYAAGYLTLGALVLLGYQTLTWLREGVWIVHRMWQVLEAIGWQHAPSVPGGRTQATVDWVWLVIGNCPIAFALSLAAMITIVLALIWGSASTRAAELRDAH